MKPLDRTFLEWLSPVLSLHRIQAILAGVSGGPDSVALLLLLHRLSHAQGLTLRVAHINYGLRGEASDQDEIFVQSLCLRLGVPLELKHIQTRDWDQTMGTGTEEKARNLRYDFFYACMEKYALDTLAIGHTQDDVLETLLFNLIRGTSPEKIARLLPYFDVQRRILRPFIPFPKKALIRFLDELGQDYCTDASNLSQRYSRNILRNQVIPLLEEINPQAAAAFFRFKDLVSLEQDLLCQSIENLLCSPLWDNQIKEKGWLRIRRPLYLKLHPVYHMRLIREARLTVVGHTRHFYYPAIASICHGIHQSVQFRYNDKVLSIWTRQNWVYFKKNDEENINVNTG